MLSRIGAALIVAGAAGLGFAGQAVAEADGSAETYTVTARADTFAFEFVETGAPAAPGGEIFYATPSTAQALLDSVGRSQGYAAAPSPGPFFATLPSNGNGVLAGFGFPFSFPDYPFYAASDYPVVPTSDKAFGPFRARAESNQYGAVGDGRSGGLTNDDPAFMSSRAAARVALDPDTRVRTAVADSRFDGFTTGPLAIGQSLAHAKMTQTPGSPPTRESSFTIGSIKIAGVEIAMTDKGFKLGDQAPPTADMAQLFGVLAQAGITVEYLPARQTETSIDSAGLKITRAGADPNGTQHKVALILGRVGTSIQGGTSPLISGDTTVVPPDNPSPAASAAGSAATPVADDPAAVDESDTFAAVPAPATDASGGTSLTAGAPPLSGPVPLSGPTAVPAGAAPALVHLASPAVAGPFPGPSVSGFYVALFGAGIALTAGSRLVAAFGVRAGSGDVKRAEPPVSVLRLPVR
ncbi:MAG: hypothetical protein QOJ23_132 [Actinomycetota bacterium]|nr:hypothetical protein [Actinomycetota bacterium]